MEDKQEMPAAYDDFLDTLACQGGRFDPDAWDDLVDRLAAHDVTHLAGGSVAYGRSASGHESVGVELGWLIRDLARAPEPRLRDAMIALLLRHPKYASAARAVMAPLPPDDPGRVSLTAPARRGRAAA